MGTLTPVTSTARCGRRQGTAAGASAPTASTTPKVSTASAVSRASTGTSGDLSPPQMPAKVSACMHGAESDRCKPDPSHLAFPLLARASRLMNPQTIHSERSANFLSIGAKNLQPVQLKTAQCSWRGISFSCPDKEVSLAPQENMRSRRNGEGGNVSIGYTIGETKQMKENGPWPFGCATVRLNNDLGHLKTTQGFSRHYEWTSVDTAQT